MTPCTRITTRAYDPRTNKVATIQNVLVRTVDDDDYYTSDEEDDSDEDMGAPPPNNTGASSTCRPVYYADAFADFDVSNGMNANNAVHQQQQTTTTTTTKNQRHHPYEPLQMTCGTATAERSASECDRATTAQCRQGVLVAKHTRHLHLRSSTKSTGIAKTHRNTRN